jgi:hypothetical protein
MGGSLLLGVFFGSSFVSACRAAPFVANPTQESGGEEVICVAQGFFSFFLNRR